MRMSKQPYPITTLNGQKSKIDPTPDYQRPPAWNQKQKQLLIDTILRGYDIPKMYWKRMGGTEAFQFEVIDGQQRLRTIWEFCSGEFALDKDMDPVGDVACAGQKYEDLDFDLRTAFELYPIDVVIVEDAIQNSEEDEIRDMFLRLQNGTTLKAQEKRNAMSGQMRDFVKSLSSHSFFQRCKFTNSRFTFDHVAAQMVCLEIAGGPTGVRDSDLNKMYAENKTFDPNGKIGKQVLRVLSYLERAFPEKTPELERYNAINLYCLTSTLLNSYVHVDTEDLLADWFIRFETERRKDGSLSEDERDPLLVEYRRLTSYSTDSEESIRSRVEFLEKRFFLAFPDIRLKDETRQFSSEQRLAIYRKNEGICQLKIHCNGEKLAWNNWHADHVIAHSKGGATTVSNGQVACPACNFEKSDS